MVPEPFEKEGLNYGSNGWVVSFCFVWPLREREMLVKGQRRRGQQQTVDRKCVGVKTLDKV